MKYSRTWPIGSSLMALAIALPSQANAQSGSATAAPPVATTQDASNAATTQADAGVADIVVTAQRRSERLQDVPISVTAFNAAQVQAKGINDLQGMTIQTPGVIITTTNSYANVRVRGVGANFSNPGLEAPVAVYVDGVPLQSSIGGNLGLLDIENVQILQGPQGTLYGRNATGGAILLNTANPTRRQEGYIFAEYGNLDHKKIEGVFNAPLTDNLAIRIAGRYDDRDGYVKNIAGGPKLGSYRNYTIRGKLRWTPDSTWTIDLAGEYYNSKDTAGELYQQTSGAPGCQACLLFGATAPGGFYETNQNNTTPYYSRYTAINFRVSKNFGDITATNIASYRKTKFGAFADFDGTDLNLFNYYYPGDFSTLTEDFQVSTAFKGALNFTVGAFFLSDVDHVTASFDGAFFGPLRPLTANRIRTTTASVFGEAYINITPRLKLTVGGRYNYDDKTQRGQNSPDGVIAFGVSSFGAKITTNSFTPRFVLDYKSDLGTFYISRSKGFKSGGFSTPAFGPAPVVKPSTVVSYEAGAKLTLLGGRLRTQTAVFYYDATNLQVQTTVLPAGSVTTNAGKSRGYGVEAGAQLRIAKGLQLELSGAYTHARYREYPNANLYVLATGPGPTPGSVVYTGGYSLISGDLAGSQVEQSPDFTGSASIAYTASLSNGAKIDLNATGRYTTKYFLYAGGESPDQLATQKGYALLNLSAGYEPAGGRFRIGLFMNNATGTKYNDLITLLSSGKLHSAAAPRTYGANLRFNF